MSRLSFLVLLGVTLGCAENHPRSVRRSVETSGTALVTDGTQVHDFGHVQNGALLEHVFRFENALGRRLSVVDTFTTCGCTSYGIPDREWEAGEAAELRIVMDTAGKRGGTSATVSVLCADDDGAQYLEQFTVEALVELSEHLYCDPPRVNLGAFSPDEAPTVSVSVVSKALASVSEARSVSLAADPRFGAVALPVDPTFELLGGVVRAVNVAVTVRGDLEPGPFRERVPFRIRFEDGRERDVALDLCGEVLSKFDVSADSLFLGAVGPNSVREFEVTLTGDSDGVEVSASHEWIVGELSSDTEQTVRVRVTAPVQTGAFEGHLHLSSAGVSQDVAVAGIVL